MHCAFNLLVFPNSMFTPLLLFCFFIEMTRFEVQFNVVVVDMSDKIGQWHCAVPL